MNDNDIIQIKVKEYYGKVLQSKNDLQTSACCTDQALPSYLKQVLALIHPEVQNKFYGCGSPIPSVLDGCSVLDIGSGTGRDCYILSKLVGESGSVIGIDMTEEQLATADQYIDYHTEKFGFKNSNIAFKQGFIEDLAALGIKDSSQDLVVSNCVINLSPAKERVFAEIFRVLKDGGELFFSDVFASRRLTEQMQTDPVLLGECLGGAMYIEDFRRLLFDLGCRDYRVYSQRKLSLNNSEIQSKTEGIDFYSITIRAFKLKEIEDRCEDYGQIVTYRGSIDESKRIFMLDKDHIFEAGKPVPVCGNTASMLSETRYAPHFEVNGNRAQHYGLFECPLREHPEDEKLGCC